jgi:hypothetical protein
MDEQFLSGEFAKGVEAAANRNPITMIQLRGTLLSLLTKLDGARDMTPVQVLVAASAVIAAGEAIKDSMGITPEQMALLKQGKLP